MNATRHNAPPPTGPPPPASVAGPDGTALDLVALAADVCVLYYERYADEDARYGEAGHLWCQHDLQHLLNWAALAAAGFVVLDHEVAWLAKLLEARDFPVARLADSLDMGATVVRRQVPVGEPMAVVLEGSAQMIRDRVTFL